MVLRWLELKLNNSTTCSAGAGLIRELGSVLGRRQAQPAMP